MGAPHLNDNMPPHQAIEYTGTNVLKQGIYQRISRWRKSLAPPNLAQMQAIKDEWNTSPAFSSSESTAPIKESPTTGVVQANVGQKLLNSNILRVLSYRS